MKGQSFAKAAYACGKILTNAEGELQKTAAKTLYPGLAYTAGEQKLSSSFEEFLIRRAAGIFPLYTFMDRQKVYQTEIESTATYDILVEGGAHDENEIDERTGEGFDLAEKVEEENLQAAREQEEEQAQAQAVVDSQSGEVLGVEYLPEELADFHFVRDNFYVVETNTDISSDLLDANKFLDMDMTIQNDNSQPQILIYHTHSQEGFVDSVAGDNSTTIVGVGDYLASLLQNTYGYNVIHNTSVFDFIDGKLDRNRAYALAEEEISGILEEYPSIEVVIDLHRDGVREGTHLVADVNGKPTAQFMFFNGLSFSKRNGVIDYLPNPYISENLALTLQLKLACEKYYPGVSRKIYLKSLRYNLHLKPKALLVEAGAQTNTLEEMMNAMEPLAFVLDQVLHGEE
ncbi:MAG: stage II sporulation protein P [Lachnospiraceae bacterium]|nr:stage II sporulation protein P [Lachnospiraceae bacterium]